MQLFEVLFLCSLLLLLINTCFGSFLAKHRVNIFKFSILLLVVHLVLEEVRWQMYTAYFLFLILSLFMLKRSAGYLVLRVSGFVLGLLLLLTAGFYSWGMPVLSIPEPDGKYPVGTTSLSLTDQSRIESHSPVPTDIRELFLEIWYPAESAGSMDETVKKTLWNELYEGERDMVGFFTEYLEAVPTNSFKDLPPYATDGPYPLIIFNHGLQMFTAQNTLLMEKLASNGYVVISIAHPFESLKVNMETSGTVIPEFITSFEKFNEGMAWIEETSKPVVEAQDSISKILDRHQRAEIMLEAIAQSEVNNSVDLWVEDNCFVLDQLLTNSGLPLGLNKLIDSSAIGIMGMSVGGATATELAKADNRIKAAINVDGLQYGSRNHLDLELPFAMIYSSDGAGVNDFLYLKSKDDYYEYYLNQARHADLTDLTLVWPILSVYGQLGPRHGMEMVQSTNNLILNFWDHYLKDMDNQQELHPNDPTIETVFKPAVDSTSTKNG